MAKRQATTSDPKGSKGAAPAGAGPTGMLRFLSPNGASAEAEMPAGLDAARLLALHRWMVFSRVFDDKMLALQRAGRIGFYGEVRGQEASVVGTGAALRDTDWVFPALREGLIMLMRGYPLDAYVASNFGNALDNMKGRQMPCHYSGASVHQVSWSSCMATQLLHAAGAAYAAKVQGDDGVFAGYVGDGGTSENDFHAALNFAGVHKTPNVFVVQNNQWAISVPTRLQTASESFAIKAKAYGFDGVRVDGNDVVAVYSAMAGAVEKARTGGGPTLIETVTFRMGGHSSSDDPTRYRDAALVEEWRRKDPIDRFESFLLERGDLDADQAREVRDAAKREIDVAVQRVEKADWPDPDSLFADVYADLPHQLAEQREEMRRLAEEYGPYRVPPH